MDEKVRDVLNDIINSIYELHDSISLLQCDDSKKARKAFDRSTTYLNRANETLTKVYPDVTEKNK